MRIRDGRLHFPRLGWLTLRRRGGNPYPDAVAKKAVLRREGGKWMATVCYEIAAPVRMDNAHAIGIDMNTRQVAVSDGQEARLMPAPDTRRLEARKRRHQRRLARHKRGSKRRARTRARLRRTERRIATVRRNWHHQTSRGLANAAGTIVVEDLETGRMTRSAKGTAEEPGRNVKAKAGLNREILATGWGNLRRMLEYKALRVIAVDPRHTSQTCAACGHVDARSRRARAFECVACGHADRADLNAARNIRRRGLALLHGEERSVLPTPVTRETDRRLAA